MNPNKPSIDLNDTGNRTIAAIILALVFIGGWWLIARNAASKGAVAADTESGEMAQEQETETAETETKPLGEVSESESESAGTASVLGPISGETPTIAGSREALDVADQPAGESVMVKNATLVQMGWIAVRDANGRTLGAGRFEAGEHADIEVPLLRGTTAGERYQVLVYVDNGNREFDLHDDILVTSADGSVAGDLFVAQ